MAHSALYYAATRGWRAPEEKRLQLVAEPEYDGKFQPARADEIAQGLLLGGEWAAKNRAGLEAAGVTHVLVVAPIAPQFEQHYTYKVCAVDDEDGEDLLGKFDELHAFITEALDNDGCVLVHCAAGASRSATVVISYLMRRLGLSWNFALDYVVRRRPVVCPNEGFLRQLQQFQTMLQS